VAAIGGLAAAAYADLPQLPAPPMQPPTPPAQVVAPLAVTPTLAPTAPQAATTPQVVKWPGGYMVINGSEVIVRNNGVAGGSTNVVTGSGNGFGNRIVVSGGAGGTTIVKNARNGVGNQLLIDPTDDLIDLDALMAGLQPVAPVAPPAPAVAPAPTPPNVAMPPAPPSYKGKATAFWSKKAFSDAYDCNLYWDLTTKLWFRYGAEDDTYRPVPTQPAPPADEK
jgi:hypothetical protein